MSTKTSKNIVSIPTSGKGAPFVHFSEDGPRIRVNVHHDDGSRDQYELNFTDFDSHESMNTEQYAFVVRKEIIASGQIDLSRWTQVGHYSPTAGTGLSSSGVPF